MSAGRRWIARIVFVVAVALFAPAVALPASAGYWVQNFTPAKLWSGPDSNAVSFGTAPQWDYFEVIEPNPSGRLYVLVARTGNYAYVDVSDVGPSGPPPSGWPAGQPQAVAASPSTAAVPTAAALPSAAQPVPASSASLGPIVAFPITADQGLWQPLQLLQTINHTWTLQALSSTGTKLDWELMSPDAAGMYQPARSLITFNIRWMRSDPRALASIVEHEAKHVADLLAGLDISSPQGCVTTEINAFREEAKTWGELVGPAGKSNPQDDLERSLNAKLRQLQTNPGGITALITRNPGYRMQCRLR